MAVTPEDVLRDGQDHTEFGDVRVRKGSVAAFVANARAWEALPEGDPSGPDLLVQLRSLLPALRAVGVLEVFAPRSERLRSALGLG